MRTTTTTNPRYAVQTSKAQAQQQCYANSPGSRTPLGGRVLVPGAAICRLSRGGCTISISSVNCKQQVRKAKKITKILLGSWYPVLRIHRLSGGGGGTAKVSSVNCKQVQKSKINNHQVVAYTQMLPSTRYAIRTSQRVGMH